jgi:aminomethyltransferase
VGTVSSGNMSPMLGVGVGMAYISPPPSADELLLEIEIRAQWVPATITKPPFHKQAAVSPNPTVLT